MEVRKTTSSGAVYRGQEVAFVEAERSDDPAILKFLQVLFGRPEYDEEWFVHVRYGSLVGRRDYYLARAVKTGQVVGVYGLAPVRLKVGAEVGTASECCNVGVHPLFWGTGLFQDLSQYALQHDARKGRRLAFCSPRRPLAVKAHVAVGWFLLTELIFYTKPVQRQELALLPECKAVSSFPAEVDVLCEAFAELFDWVVCKDHAYLNWRYGRDCYRRFVHYDEHGRPCGLLVLKEYREEAGLQRMHIMELITTGAGSHTLLTQAAHASPPGDEQHTWADEHSPQAEALEAFGFTQDRGRCPLLVYPYTAQARAMLASTGLRYVALGDDEAF